MEFLVKKKGILIPATNSLLVMRIQIGIVLANIKRQSDSKFFSALQFKKEFRHKEPSYFTLGKERKT